jgi:hypothetical protein
MAVPNDVMRTSAGFVDEQRETSWGIRTETLLDIAEEKDCAAWDDSDYGGGHLGGLKKREMSIIAVPGRDR